MPNPNPHQIHSRSARKTKRKRRVKGEAVVTGKHVSRGIGISISISSSDPDEARNPSMYCVVTHSTGEFAYSLFKVDPFCDLLDPPVPIARLHAKEGMTFAPMRSDHRSWIVGVGGYSDEKFGASETLLFDTETQAVIPGPDLSAAKDDPVVVAVGDRVYALARYPDLKKEPDFWPWFEVLDLKDRIHGGHLLGCSWRPLPRPPCFPWSLTPRQFLTHRVSVESYAVVDSHLLLSISEAAGTQAFNLETEEWQQVDEDSLPFTGYAVPHGPLFLGVSANNKAITAYHIMVCPSCPAVAGMSTNSIALSITEYPITAPNTVKDPHDFFLSSLQNGYFCSLDFWTNSYPWEYTMADMVCITLKSYKMKEALPAKASKVAIAHHKEHKFEACNSSGDIDFPYLAGAFSI